jgi:MbtH protein
MSTRWTGEPLSINPFGDDNGSPFVFVTGEEQRILWPASDDIPAGGRVVRGEVDLAACLDHIETNWTDAQATSLRERVAAGQAFVM